MNRTHRLLTAALLLASSRAKAEPLTKVPTASVPCAMNSVLELQAVESDLVLCAEDGCMKLDLDAGRVSLVDRPAARSAWLEPLADVKQDTVCLGTVCKSLGKKLVAALAKARDEALSPPTILATSDLKTVVVETTAWNIERDRQIKLARPVGVPPVLGKSNNKPLEVERIDVVGDLLLVHWANCTDGGLCLRAVLTTGTGHALGTHHGGGGLAPIQLAPETGFVLVSERGSVEFYGAKSRKLEASIELEGRPGAAVRIDSRSIGVLYESFADSKALQVAKISWWEDEAIVARAMTLPHCAVEPPRAPQN